MEGAMNGESTVDENDDLASVRRRRLICVSLMK